MIKKVIPKNFKYLIFVLCKLSVAKLRILYLVGALSINALCGFGQKDTSNFFNVFQKPSYLSISGGVSTFQPLICEARLTNAYFLNPKSDLTVRIVPAIVFRMLDAKSHPVLRPSYIVDAGVLRRLSNVRPLWLLAEVGHHSNGASRPFCKNSQRCDVCLVDFEDGNFGISYLRLGFQRLCIRDSLSVLHFAAHWEFNPYLGYNRCQQERYGAHRLFLGWQWRKTIRQSLWHLSLEINLIPSGKDRWREGRVFSTSLMVCWQPQFLKGSDFWVFGHAYAGEDYLHNYFMTQIYFVRLGLAAKMSRL